MTEIQRYEMDEDGLPCEIEGEGWCKHDDVEPLEQRIEELKISLQQAENAIEKMRPLMLLPDHITELENDLRSLADAVMRAESLLCNDLYKTRVHNALVELDEVRDIAMNHMSEE